MSGTVAAIEHMAEVGRSEQFVQGQDMRASQVADVDIVPNSSSIRSGEIATVNRHFRPLAKRCFDGDLDEVSGAGARRSRSPQGVRTGNIKIAQRAVVERVTPGHVVQHAFRHKLRPPVRGCRSWRGIFGYRIKPQRAVNRCRRGKYEVAHLLRDGALEKRLARYGIVAIIFERIADGLRRDRRAGEVKDAADLMVAQEPSDKRLVFRATLDEGRARIEF